MSNTEGAGPAGRDDRTATPVFRSETLLSARKEAIIEHRGERYLLRETSKGKLILTK